MIYNQLMENFFSRRIFSFIYPFFLITFVSLIFAFLIFPKLERLIIVMKTGAHPIIQTTPTPTPPLTGGPSARTYFVGPKGKDSNNGSSKINAFASVQKALEVAQPGDTITLDSGEYRQDFKTVRDGTSDRPITIIGPQNARIKGSGDNSHVVEINHSFIHLIGFTIDGFGGGEQVLESYRDKLLYIHGIKARHAIEGIHVYKMTIKNAGGECVRLRYLINQSEIAYNTITNCGIHDFQFADGGKNGEGIYIGTAPEQRNDGKNPTSDPDQSNNNWIHHNTINTQGNECVDIKEGSSFNTVEYNSCTGQKDPNSAGLDSRGNTNTFRFNESFNTIGAGVRLGGDAQTDGINNEVYGNILRNNRGGGIKLERMPQTRLCDNTILGIESDRYAVGKFGDDIDPTQGCE